jgi:hypothetical protein
MNNYIIDNDSFTHSIVARTFIFTLYGFKRPTSVGVRWWYYQELLGHGIIRAREYGERNYPDVEKFINYCKIYSMYY